MKVACGSPQCQTTPQNCANISHCTFSRSALLYRLLASLDNFLLTERAKDKSRQQARQNQYKAQGSGIGFGSGSRIETTPADQYNTFLSQNQSQARDFQLCNYFRGLRLILTKSGDEIGLLGLMRTSLLGQVMEELLRNDSISDCSERAELYTTFLASLQAIATNSQLAGFYTSEREGIERTDGLARIISGQGQLVKTKKGNNTGPWSFFLGPTTPTIDTNSPALLDLIQTLGKQADTFYNTASRVSGGLMINTADHNAINSVNICKSIRTTRKVLQNTANTALSSGTVALPPSKPRNSTESYHLACKKLAYDEFPAYATDTTFKFQNRAMGPIQVNPRRTITLAKELSTMATSLPPGIFLRNMPNRPDCIKALIIGVEGTPYHGGIWEFDIWATGEYPVDPPLVHLNTTSNQRVRFNPNLYAYIPKLK